MAARPLVLQNAIGYNGKVSGGLLLHESEDAAHVIYTLGSTIVIRNVEDAKDQAFLRGARPPAGCSAGRSAARPARLGGWRVPPVLTRRRLVPAYPGSPHASGAVPRHEPRQDEDGIGSDQPHGLLRRCLRMGHHGAHAAAGGTRAAR